MQNLVINKYIKTIEKEFGIKEKKEIKFLLSAKIYGAPSEVYTPSDVSKTIKEASLSAVTSPHLRAIFVLIETDDKKELIIIESEEVEMSKEEKVGVLLNANKRMMGVKEIGIKHAIDPSNISSFLFHYTKNKRVGNIHIINVHHDYIRSFYQHSVSTGDFIWNIMENDTFTSTEVISKLTKEGG